MDKPNFTPGPWNTHEHYNPIDVEPTICEGFEAITISIAAGEKIIGTADGFIHTTGYDGGYPRCDNYDEARANARLMVAAPEMYEALKAYEELDDKHANCEECDGEIQPELCAECFPYADAARLRMRAAIAKVEAH